MIQSEPSLMGEKSFFRPSLKMVILSWIAIEICCLVFLVSSVGWVITLAAETLLTIIGLRRLKNVGYGAVKALQIRVGQGYFGKSLDGSDILEGLAALLLILPGFATDLVGLALLAPSLRHQLHHSLANSKRHQDRQSIELSTKDWRSLP